MTAYLGNRTQSAGTDFTYRPRPHSWLTTYQTEARHSPGSGHHTQPSCSPRTHSPSWRTSTVLGSMRRTRDSGTPLTVGGLR